MTKIILALAVASMLLVSTLATTASPGSKAGRISISYVPPTDPELRKIHADLMERRVLERLQEFLKPFRLPRRLKITLTGCDGEADAFYGDDTITICYEYVDRLWDSMPEKTTPGGIAPFDAVVGPFFDTCLHEFAHALFDMLKVPVLGREEDAADQVATYIYLQLGTVQSRRLIMGTVYAYLKEAQSADRAPSLEQFADDHSTPAQRAYNVMCIGYGANTKVFGDFVSKGHLPKGRAGVCEEEYEQVQDAYEALIGPHIDQALAAEIFDRTWLRNSTGRRPR